MRYMLMFYEREAEVAAQRDGPDRTGPYWDAWNAFIGALYPAGIVVSGNALLPLGRPPRCGSKAATAWCRTGRRRRPGNSWAAMS